MIKTEGAITSLLERIVNVEDLNIITYRAAYDFHAELSEWGVKRTYIRNFNPSENVPHWYSNIKCEIWYLAGKPVINTIRLEPQFADAYGNRGDCTSWPVSALPPVPR